MVVYNNITTINREVTCRTIQLCKVAIRLEGLQHSIQIFQYQLRERKQVHVLEKAYFT